tara:strand:- start:607 stop:891 length:285 start_codon:yes stop_codon:yes gene_type:complete
MAITKLTDDKTNNKYDEVIPATEDEMDSNQLFLKKLVDKIDEGLDETNKSIVASNTTISFGDMTESRGTYTIVLTATRDFGKGNVSKSITLTLR